MIRRRKKDRDEQLLRELRRGQDAILEAIAEVMAGQNKMLHQINEKVDKIETRVSALEKWKKEHERRHSA